jgi:hypothetical protein
MDRINSATKAVDLYGAGKHGFKDGNLGLSITPTDLNAAWFNGVQEELLAAIEAAGIVPAAATRNQLVLALRAAGLFTTPALFDNTTKAATTAFVQRALGNLQASVGYAVSSAIPVGDCGKLLVFGGAAAAQTLSLPPLAGIPEGACIRIINTASVPVSVAPGGGDLMGRVLMGIGVSPAASVSLLVGDSSAFYKFGGTWYEAGGLRLENVSSLACSAQSWQNVAASRAVNTTYTNTSGRPIAIVAGGTATVANGFYSVQVNGVVAASANVATGFAFTLSAIVPAGGNYILSKGGADTFTAMVWSELR